MVKPLACSYHIWREKEQEWITEQGWIFQVCVCHNNLGFFEYSGKVMVIMVAEITTYK